MKRTRLFVGATFALLFLGIFLGDGKQQVVEVYGASVVLVLWVARMFQKRPVVEIPRTLLYPWIAIFAVSTVSALQSDSIGYSFSWIVRLLSAYLLYRLYFDLASVRSARFFIHASFIFVIMASAFAVLSLCFSWITAVIPSMNLVTTRYGHNHIADLLVFAAPLLWWIVVDTKRANWVTIGAWIAYLCMLFVSLARGAWLIVGLYVGASFVFLKPTERKRRTTQVVLLTIIMIVIGWFGGRALLAQYADAGGAPARWYRLMTRPQTIGSRLEYWRQATEATKERPIFGSGPGTFSLLSQRLQKSKGQSSWFAHSQPLQVAAEMGIVGLLAFSWLIIAHATYFLRPYKIVRAEDMALKTITWSLCLVFLYGLFEFVLDYQVTWLLFWAGTGFVAGTVGSNQSNKSARSVSVLIPLGCVVVFYVLWVSSAVVALTTRRYDTAYYLAPFDASSAMVMLSLPNTKTITNRDIDVMLLFHKKNPAILAAMAKSIVQTNPERSISFIEKSVIGDPQNADSFIEYIHLLLQNPNKAYLANLLTKTTNDGVDFFSPILFPLLTEQLFEDVGRATTMREYKAKLYYFVGFALLDKHPDQTRILWTLARNVAPGWGYFHVELESLYYYAFNMADYARQILEECKRYAYSKKQCEAAPWPPVPPGQFLKQVQAIPAI